METKKRPLIGLVPLVDYQRASYWMLPGYMEGVAQAGGVPVMLPLTEDDRANRESVMYFRDPFKLTPVSAVAEMADKFTRNEIMTSNEFRQAIGMKPSKDPKADELRNANISQSSEEIAAQNKTITAGRDAVERSIANQNG